MKILVTLVIAISLGAAPVFLACGQENIEPRISIAYFRTGDDLPYLKILVRKRIERRYYPMEGMTVHAYFNEETDDHLMGRGITNYRGESIIEMPTAMMDVWHGSNEFEYIVNVDPTDSSDAVSESISIRKARIQLTSSEDRMITAVIEQREDSVWVPVEDVELRLFVRRQFGRLPVTEDPLSTDAEGKVEAAFSAEVPGDAQGVVTFGCWLEDHDEFGNIIAYTSAKWGIPTVDDNSAFERRTLWATRDRTPLWLIVFPSLIIAGVWGVIFFLIYQIIQIKRISKSSE